VSEEAGVLAILEGMTAEDVLFELGL
jgi:hypothetical protein